MISDQITHLIDQVKQHPNGETRNSLLGRLKDAKAHAFMLEREEFMKPNKPADGNALDYLEGCICPSPGVRAKSCLAPIHK